VVSAFGVLLLAVVARAQEPLRLDADAPRSGQARDGSVDRVRAALEKPPSKLTLQDRTPDFSVHIEKRRPCRTSSTSRRGSSSRAAGSRRALASIC